MRKSLKILAMCLILLTVGILGASAKGGLRLGLEFGIPNAVIIIRPEPFDFKIGYDFLSGDQNIFISADYRIISGLQLIDFLHMLFGLGAYTQIYFNRSDPIDLGARVPVGLQAFLLDSVVEIFMEVCPTVRFFPSLAFGGIQGWLGFTIRIPKY